MHRMKYQIMDVSITRGSLGFIKKIVEFSTGIVDTQKYFSEGEGGGRGGHMKIVIHLPIRSHKDLKKILIFQKSKESLS